MTADSKKWKKIKTNKQHRTIKCPTYFDNAYIVMHAGHISFTVCVLLSVSARFLVRDMASVGSLRAMKFDTDGRPRWVARHLPFW